MAIDAGDHPNDSFGYSVYAVVAFAAPEQADAADAALPLSGHRRTLSARPHPEETKT